MQSLMPEKQKENEEYNELSFFKIISKYLRQYSMFFFLVLIMVIFQVLTNGILLRPLNVTNIILQNSHILILAIGMLIIIVLGHIDLSVGSVAAFTGAIAAILMINNAINPFLATLLCLLIGALIGAWQGFWVAYVKVPAFIVTLAGMLIFRGLTIVVLEGRTIASFPPIFRSLSSGFIPDIFNGSQVHLLTLIVGVFLSLIGIGIMIHIRKKKQAYGFMVESTAILAFKILGLIGALVGFCYILSMHEGIPNILIILSLLIFSYHFVTNHMKVGRYIYAIGGNIKAAQLSGIKTKGVTFWAFVNMGVLAALSGLIFSARLNASTAAAGNLFELDAIAACFIGGASAYGGVGKVMGAIIGGLVMAIINNGMSLLGIGVDWQQAIKGLVLLMAVAFDIYNKNKAS